jgi:hypothetical protein
MSRAFIRSTIEVRHSNFSCFAATALSKIGATSTVFAGAEGAGAVDECDAGGAAVAPPLPPADAGGAPLGLDAPAELPKTALMIFPKMLIACSDGRTGATNRC